MKFGNIFCALSILIITFSATAHTQSPPSLPSVPTITPPAFTPPVLAPPSITVPQTRTVCSIGSGPNVFNDCGAVGEKTAKIQMDKIGRLIIDQELKDSGFTYSEYAASAGGFTSPALNPQDWRNRNYILPHITALAVVRHGSDRIKEAAKRIVLKLELSLKTSIQHYESAKKSGDCDFYCKGLNEGKIEYTNEYLQWMEEVRSEFSDQPLQRRIAK